VKASDGCRHGLRHGRSLGRRLLLLQRLLHRLRLRRGGLRLPRRRRRRCLLPLRQLRRLLRQRQWGLQLLQLLLLQLRSWRATVMRGPGHRRLCRRRGALRRRLRLPCQQRHERRLLGGCGPGGDGPVALGGRQRNHLAGALYVLRRLLQLLDGDLLLQIVHHHAHARAKDALAVLVVPVGLVDGRLGLAADALHKVLRGGAEGRGQGRRCARW
jgi:hypothetical protein